MRYDVVLTRDAESDLEHIYRYIAEHDSKESADHVLERLLDPSDSLAAHPERGSIPKELRYLGMAEYRQVFFRPYRLIYRAHTNQVVIYLIADGRRDMQSFLARRNAGSVRRKQSPALHAVTFSLDPLQSVAKTLMNDYVGRGWRAS